jgi:hypothetical protein
MLSFIKLYTQQDVYNKGNIGQSVQSIYSENERKKVEEEEEEKEGSYMRKAA